MMEGRKKKYNIKVKVAKFFLHILNPFLFPSASQQQQQKLALPPQQTKADAVVEKAPASSAEPQEETPMEQDNPEGEASSEPNSEDTSKKGENQDTADHAKMPEHPGRDSDSDGEDSGEEQGQ